MRALAPSGRPTGPLTARFAKLAAALAFAVGISARPALAQSWTFEDVATPTTSPFSQAKGGITATFYSSAIAPFGAPSPYFTTLTGNVLVGQPIVNITFSQAVTGMHFQWGLMSPSATTPLALLTFLGEVNLSNLVSSTTYSGSAVKPLGQSFINEGSATYSGSAFDAVVICAFDAQFGCAFTGTTPVIDNLSVTVPEPTTVPLLAAGLAGLGLAARRRRRAPVA